MAAETPPETPPPLVETPVAELPPRLAALCDPARPLARPERFVPGGLIAPGQPFVTLLVGGAFGLGLFAAALYAWARAFEAGVDDFAGQYIAPALAGVAWTFAASAWLSLRRAREQRDHLDRGAWRRGLFVEDDGLLIARGVALDSTARTATWVPRDAIDRIELRAGDAWLIAPDGRALPLPGDGAALAARLAPWRSGGSFGWTERV